MSGAMTEERYFELCNNMEMKLTAQEILDGYYFCCEWDGLLINKDDPEAAACTCVKDGGKEPIEIPINDQSR